MLEYIWFLFIALLEYIWFLFIALLEYIWFLFIALLEYIWFLFIALLEYISLAVYSDGRVCISILHAPGDDPMGYESSAERWSPVQSVEKILLSVVSMLAGELSFGGQGADILHVVLHKTQDLELYIYVTYLIEMNQVSVKQIFGK